MTPAEDEAITRAANRDADALPMSDVDFARARRGRPPLGVHKRQLTVRLDQDIVDALKADGAGWQTRMNAMLREKLQLGD